MKASRKQNEVKLTSSKTGTRVMIRLVTKYELFHINFTNMVSSAYTK